MHSEPFVIGPNPSQSALPIRETLFRDAPAHQHHRTTGPAVSGQRSALSRPARVRRRTACAGRFVRLGGRAGRVLLSNYRSPLQSERGALGLGQTKTMAYQKIFIPTSPARGSGRATMLAVRRAQRCAGARGERSLRARVAGGGGCGRSSPSRVVDLVGRKLHVLFN